MGTIAKANSSGFLEVLVLVLINLSIAPLCFSMNASNSFLFFLFSLPDGYFLDYMIVLYAEIKDKLCGKFKKQDKIDLRDHYGINVT